MPEPGLKELTTHRRVKLGTLVAEFATPGIGHMLKSAGCDFAFLDMEHSGFTIETIKSVIRYFEAGGLPILIRVPSQDYHFIARAMDMGAEGLMAPMVSTVEQAQHIINSMKYHPLGARGVALQIAHDRYRPGSVADKFAAANQRSTFFCLIETADGVKNVDAIAALDGLDCLWVGHFDLSVSLGIPGDFANPKFTAAMDAIVAAAKKHNKSLGRLVSSIQQGADCFAQGFDFVCYSGDVWVFHDAMADATSKIRAACNQN